MQVWLGQEWNRELVVVVGGLYEMIKHAIKYEATELQDCGVPSCQDYEVAPSSSIPHKLFGISSLSEISLKTYLVGICRKVLASGL